MSHNHSMFIVESGYRLSWFFKFNCCHVLFDLFFSGKFLVRQACDVSRFIYRKQRVVHLLSCRIRKKNFQNHRTWMEGRIDGPSVNPISSIRFRCEQHCLKMRSYTSPVSVVLFADLSSIKILFNWFNSDHRLNLWLLMHTSGQGSSLIICVGILTGYTDTLYKMLVQLSGWLLETKLLWSLKM